MRFKLFVENLGVFVDSMIDSKGHYDRDVRMIGSDWLEENGKEDVAKMLRAAASGDKNTFHRYKNQFVGHLMRNKGIHVDTINNEIVATGWNNGLSNQEIFYILRPNGLFRLGKNLIPVSAKTLSDDMNLAVLILIATKMNSAGGRQDQEHLQDITPIMKQLDSYRNMINRSPLYILKVSGEDIAKTLEGLAIALRNGVPPDKKNAIRDVVQYFSNLDGGIINNAAAEVLALLR